jgi:hypothetical protein
LIPPKKLERARHVVASLVTRRIACLDRALDATEETGEAVGGSARAAVPSMVAIPSVDTARWAAAAMGGPKVFSRPQKPGARLFECLVSEVPERGGHL